jgi:rubrerythrin
MDQTRKRTNENPHRCPYCLWVASPDDDWYCDKCGCVWDTFETHGKCPICGYQWTQTKCPSCNHWSPHDDWYAVKRVIN